MCIYICTCRTTHHQVRCVSWEFFNNSRFARHIRIETFEIIASYFDCADNTRLKERISKHRSHSSVSVDVHNMQILIGKKIYFTNESTQRILNVITSGRFMLTRGIRVIGFFLIWAKKYFYKSIFIGGNVHCY